MKALLVGFGFALLLTAACGSDTSNTTTGANTGGSGAGTGGSGAAGGGATGSGASAGSASGSGAAGSTASGTGAGGAGSCDPGEVQVFPCCGGPAPLCEPLPDGGNCPPGTHPANCADGPGCEMDPCVAPPPYCANEADLKCMGSNCSTSSGDCYGYLDDGVLSCQCA